ncbi:MAG: epimerase [Deltaproteobacteria bacterium HGW-Deltaproteobacteria-14]|jgi:uncharacterized protein YbjT (DUF2867 family)|nr:MAG: epimerase [Deltaproteobacteria bacterium HGW-Deltaproteobacteria-14]
MNVVIFGASGMVGHGALIECLEGSEVASVRVVGRSSAGVEHPKLREIAHSDFLDFTAIEPDLTGLDACFWCLGVSSSGMSEADYRRITHDFTVAAAETLLRLNPALTMCFVSGTGTDSSAAGSTMWARVKGATENALLAMPFATAAMFRPGYIQPRKGVKSKTRSYRWALAALRPLYPLIKLSFGARVTTTDTIGRAMIRVAREGTPKPILTAPDINALGALPG